MATDLSDDDKAMVVELVRKTIAADRFPLSPRVRELKAILAKLEPPEPRHVPYPPAQAGGRAELGCRADARIKAAAVMAIVDDYAGTDRQAMGAHSA